MKSLSIGKIRGLQQCSTMRGTFTCLALDHRQNLRRALNPQDSVSVPDSALTNFKLEVTAALAGEATAVLLDPEYSAAQAVAGGGDTQKCWFGSGRGSHRLHGRPYCPSEPHTARLERGKGQAHGSQYDQTPGLLPS